MESLQFIRLIKLVFWVFAILMFIVTTLGITYCSPVYDSFFDWNLNFFDQDQNLVPKNNTVNQLYQEYYQGNNNK